MSERIREIPYNYTSLSDKEIILRFLDDEAWAILEDLRATRRTGISARMLFEVLGDMWVVKRNPYIQDDLLENNKRLMLLIEAMNHRIDQIITRADSNQDALRLAQKAKQAVQEFGEAFVREKKRRRRAIRRFGRHTKKDNIDFGGLARVSHVTDATDWRVEYPFVVLTPDSERELAHLVADCVALGLTVIPRGGGTGYTGGAIPLTPDSAVINTEKLEKLSSVEWRQLPGIEESVPTVQAEAGVVTKRVSELAESEGLAFAVDPTSQDACTIGGNIAMNAGGKKAVLWGTTLDNLVSWKMVTPEAKWLEVQRLDHNLGKIHDQDTVKFAVTRYKSDGRTQESDPEILTFPGRIFRKDGLGKDVTDKFLGGLPGIQKEGCDGLITSGVFILHRKTACIRTVCLEFYGNETGRAVSAIVEIKRLIEENSSVKLVGLEHLDERYLRAVGYTPKSARGLRPKMILLADIGADDEDHVALASSEVVRIANRYSGEGFVAVSAEARRRFWADRARTAAIAAHTNAFKINEDVVIPLERLSEYTEGVERINIRLSLSNKLELVQKICDDLENSRYDGHKILDFIDSAEGETEFSDKKSAALSRLYEVRSQWLAILDHLDDPAVRHIGLVPEPLRATLTDETLSDLLLKRRMTISYRQEIERPLCEIFDGRVYDAFRQWVESIHQQVLRSRLFVALHMHAGDGNVHTNIPVNSNDYAMMRAAEQVVDEIMILAQSLDGVVSGEHGIGLTKMQYLDSESIEAFAQYKRQIDPKDVFNKGKLMPGSGLARAYTPSLRLVEQEALIMEATELGDLNRDIKDCLRCGKCKPVCTTHVPRANLLYSPRNKILATLLMIEAFLYEEQTRRGISLRHFEQLNDIADHCTICHRCLKPCPVDIDFGDVTIRIRRILEERRQRKSRVMSKLSMAFLNIKDPRTIKLMRKALIEWGYKGQRLGHFFYNLMKLGRENPLPASTTGQASIPAQVINFVRQPMPGRLPHQTMRAMLGVEDSKMVPVLRDPEKTSVDSEAVFYFPGCGSERLFSQIGLATLAALFEQGVQTVLPPGYLCCGYPQTSAGEEEKGRKITMENRVLFHRVANTLNYLDIKTVIVSCGTCMDQLLKYEFENIFPGCRLLDIHEFLMEKGAHLDGVEGVRYVYHEPCHTPMKSYNSLKVASTLMAQDVPLSDRCCGEAGTFAVSRPDIATQVKFRKEEELRKNIRSITGQESVAQEEVKLLTSCPACQQGLMRYEEATGLQTDYIVVEYAKHKWGEDWASDFLEKAASGGVEKILL